MGAKKSQNGYIFFVNNQKISLTKKEVEKIMKIADAKKEIAPGDENIFGVMNLKQTRRHLKVIYGMKKKGLIEYVMIDGLVRVRLSELGTQIYNIMLQLE